VTGTCFYSDHALWLIWQGQSLPVFGGFPAPDMRSALATTEIEWQARFSIPWFGT
jgi:hypothetical protein